MGKWGEINQICVKITIYKGCNDGEVIYYRNKLPMWIVEQWRWYFDYLAALVKVNNPRLKVELTTCAQTLKQGQEYIEEKSKTLLRAKESKLKRLENTPVQEICSTMQERNRTEKFKPYRAKLTHLNGASLTTMFP